MGTFSIFWTLFEIKEVFYGKHVYSDKIKLENHSLENQTWSLAVLRYMNEITTEYCFLFHENKKENFDFQHSKWVIFHRRDLQYTARPVVLILMSTTYQYCFVLNCIKNVYRTQVDQYVVRVLWKMARTPYYISSSQFQLIIDCEKLYRVLRVQAKLRPLSR